MSDGEADGAGDLLARRHRKERKELQGKIAALKKSVAKGDKKRKKDAHDEIARWEAELADRHAQELQGNTALSNGDVEAADCDEQAASADTSPPRTRQSKAHKRREKKEIAEREHQAAVAADQQSAATSKRAVESSALDSLLSSRRLRPVPVAADGDCLYKALGHRTALPPLRIDAGELRQAAADYMRAHRADFEPFLELDGGRNYDTYCDRVQGLQGPVWGGQPELRALSCALRLRIEVLQADGQPSIVFEPPETQRRPDAEPIVITYHRHAYRLGEHYNATEPIIADE